MKCGPLLQELLNWSLKNGCHTHINAEKWSGENLTNLTACYGYALVDQILHNSFNHASIA